MIACCVVWAIRGNSIALFGNPTPINCIIDKGHNDYIASFHLLWQFHAFLGSYKALHGLFESKFIIQVLQQ
jgi:hypothetical protein